MVHCYASGCTIFNRDRAGVLFRFPKDAGRYVRYVTQFLITAILTYIYKVSQEECARLRESVPYVKVYRYNPEHLYPKLNGYGDNGQRSLKL